MYRYSDEHLIEKNVAPNRDACSKECAAHPDCDFWSFGTTGQPRYCRKVSHKVLDESQSRKNDGLQVSID